VFANNCEQRPDGRYNVPDTSIVLQGCSVQMTGRDQDTQDIVLVCNYLISQSFNSHCERKKYIGSVPTYHATMCIGPCVRSIRYKICNFCAEFRYFESKF